MIIRDLDHHQSAYLKNIKGGSYPWGMANLVVSINTLAEGTFAADVKSKFDSITISEGPVKTSGFSFLLSSMAMG